MTTREQQAIPAQRTDGNAETPEPPPLSGSIAAPPEDARQLALEIERTREQLGETVQELVARVDVKSRALAKASEVSGKCKSTMVQARERAATRAGGMRGALERWAPLAAVTGAVILDCLAVWQWRRDQ